MHETRLSLVAPSRDLETLIEKTKAYIRGAKAPATLLAYKSDFRDFTRFCREHNLSFLPSTPETVALYITDCASRLASGTITRRLTSITKAHQSAGCKDSPASTHHFIVSETLKGIRRAIGTAQHGKKPLLTADIRKIVAHCPKSLPGTRDRALVIIGFAGAFRRSELAAPRSRTSRSRKTAWLSTCVVRRPISKRAADRSVFPSGRMPGHVRFARCAAG